MHQVLLNHHNQNQNEPACEGSAAERRNSVKRNNHCQDPQNGTQVLIHNSIVPRHYHWDVTVVSSQLMPTLTRTEEMFLSVIQWNVQLRAVQIASDRISYNSTYPASSESYHLCIMRSCCISCQMVNVSQWCVFVGRGTKTLLLFHNTLIECCIYAHKRVVSISF